MPASIECWFPDVGQGAANVVLLGDGRAIVVDCGPAGSQHVLLSLLKRFVQRIEVLIASHNDADHVGAAPAVLTAYPKAIGRIYHVQDRPLKKDPLFLALRRELRAGNLSNPPCSFTAGESVKSLFSDESLGLELTCVSPGDFESKESQFHGEANASSAVVVLKVHGRRVVFAGDSTVGQWRSLRERLGRPLDCDFLAVSHHGGCTWDANADADAENEWLYSEGVRPKFAVLSVGSANDYDHPQPVVVRRLVGCGASVLCTQITRQCHDDLESLRPGLIPPADPSASTHKSRLTRGGRSRNVGCAGTVSVLISESDLRLRRLEEHRQAVGLLASRGGTPLCRPNA